MHGVIDYLLESRGLPGGFKVAKVEALVILVWPNPLRHSAQRHNPGLSSHDAIVVFIDDLAPLANDLVNTVLAPERMWLRAVFGLVLFLTTHGGGGFLNIGKAIGLHQTVSHVNAEATGSAV